MANTIMVNHPEHVREGDYAYTATYVPEDFGYRAVWIEAGSDEDAWDALVQLKGVLKDSGFHDDPDSIEVDDPGEWLKQDA